MNDDPTTRDDLDQMLQDHFARQLNPQLGRAHAGWIAHVERQRRFRSRLISATALVSGLAAALLISHALAPRTQPTNAPPPQQGSQIAQSTTSTTAIASQAPVQMVRTAAWSGVVDHGLSTLNDRPVRQYRREVIEEERWYDPGTKATIVTKTPRQQVILIGVRTD